MVTVYVPDIGDGLAAGIRTIAGCAIQIDCGSQQHPERAFHKGLCRINPDVFFLSHFHVDHYNGLFEFDRFRPHPFSTTSIEEVYFPRVPQFAQREHFLQCMLAMNRRVMGDATGSMEADFLCIISQINRRSFFYSALSAGDKVQVQGSEMEVLWPPRFLDDEYVLKVIRKAVSDFEAAKAKDETLRRIYEELGESGQMRPYTDDDNQRRELPGNGNEPRETRLVSRKKRELSEVVKKANESLRGAANHLSLAFHEDNKFLFMGDLESREIKQVVDRLLKKKREHFLVFITPHHGTHWHQALGNLRADSAISSVGNRLFKHLSPEFKSMASQCLYTHLSGDIEVPVLSQWWHGHRSMREWNTFL